MKNIKNIFNISTITLLVAMSISMIVIAIKIPTSTTGEYMVLTCEDTDTDNVYYIHADDVESIRINEDNSIGIDMDYDEDDTYDYQCDTLTFETIEK